VKKTLVRVKQNHPMIQQRWQWQL